MQSDNLLNVDLSQPLHRISNLNRNKVSRFRQPINNDPNRIKTLQRLRKTDHKIHGNTIPFPLRHKQRLQHSRRLLMLNLRFLTHQTSINKLNNTLLHSWPPKQLLQILIHLPCSRMNTQSTSMTFFKNPSLQLRQIRYTNSISESQNSKLIQSEIFSFALINQSHTTYKIHI